MSIYIHIYIYIYIYIYLDTLRYLHMYLDIDIYRYIDILCIIYVYIQTQVSVARSTLAGGFDITVSGERFATAPPGLAKVRFGTYTVSATQLVRHLNSNLDKFKSDLHIFLAAEKNKIMGNVEDAGI